jgi:hypothetical protein
VRRPTRGEALSGGEGPDPTEAPDPLGVVGVTGVVDATRPEVTSAGRGTQRSRRTDRGAVVRDGKAHLYWPVRSSASSWDPYGPLHVANSGPAP